MTSPDLNRETETPTISSDLWAEWLQACGQVGVTVDEKARERLARFYALLIETNRVTNLTRITAPEDFLYRHLLDSLSVAPFIPSDAFVVDIGSGAGFPAIPLAVVRPDVTVTAVEATEKKIRFIELVREALNLQNLNCKRERSETLARDKNFRGRADLVTARAVAALPVLLELCIPFLKMDGLFLAMKGRSCDEELAASERAFKMLGASLERIHAFESPRLEGSRLLLIRKFRPTLPEYPRAAGLPAKKPL